MKGIKNALHSLCGFCERFKRFWVFRTLRNQSESKQSLQKHLIYLKVLFFLNILLLTWKNTNKGFGSAILRKNDGTVG